MKRKYFTKLLSIVVAATLLTGCGLSDIPFLNKDSEGSGDEEQLPVEDTRVTIIEGQNRNVGDTVMFDDIATVSPAEMGNVIQKVIGQDDGTISDSYTFSEEGMYTLTLMIEFIDGSVWDGQCSVYVSAPTLELPDTLYNNIKTRDWVSSYIEEVGQSSDGDLVWTISNILLSSVVDDATISGGDKILGFSMNSGQQDGSDVAVCVVSPEDLAMLQSLGISPFATDVPFTSVIGMMESMVAALSEESSSEDKEQVMQFLEWYKQWYNSCVTTTTIASSAMLYDTSGLNYPVNIIQYTIDMTPYGGSVADVSGPAYIDYDGRRILFSVADYGTMFSNGDVTLPTDDEESEESALPATYDEFAEFMKTVVGNGDMNFAINNRSTVQDTENIIKRLSNVIIIGDVSPLKPDEEVGTVVADETPEEPVEEVGVIKDIYVPYAQQHPEIFTWPENETKYRRWVYIIDNKTSFVSSIINPDGTAMISGAVDGGEDWRIESNTGSSQTLPNAQPTVEDNTYTISSSYSTYELHTAGMQGASYAEELSTSGRVVVTYGGHNYYIETVRASQVQNYMGNCLYPTTDFVDGAFEVVEHTAEAQTTSIGKIIPYTVKYTDQFGTAHDDPYMEVYNVYNDYLCIYSDTIPSDKNVMRDILWNMVTLKE